MRRPRRRRRPLLNHSGHPSPIRRLLLLTAVIVAIIFFLDSRLRPVVERMAAYQVKVFAAKTINSALIGELEKFDVDYNDLVKVTQKSDGSVTSIQSNMMAVNRLKGQMSRSIIRDMENSSQPRSVRVPLGTLLGNELLSGRGPLVEIRILPVGYVQTETYNQFASAGINQTLHQIMLRVNVQMTAIIPGYSISTETVTNFCVAETVIVGSIPEAFTQIDGDDSPLISKVNDYGAGN